ATVRLGPDLAAGVAQAPRSTGRECLPGFDRGRAGVREVTVERGVGVERERAEVHERPADRDPARPSVRGIGEDRAPVAVHEIPALYLEEGAASVAGGV